MRMQQDRDNIKDTLARYGERFDPDQLERPFAEWFTRARMTARLILDGRRKQMDARWANRPLHVIFVRNPDMNAFATKSEVADYIVITVGAVETIFGTMCGLMSSPSFLPEIGDVSTEEEPEGPFPNGLPRMPLLRKDHFNDEIAVYHPSNTARMAFAMQLAEDALHFLTLHELGHILGGHLELCEANGAKPELLEIGQSSPGPVNQDVRQVLEYDADIFAAHVASFVAMHPMSGELVEETFEWSNVDPQDAGAILYLTAVNVLFRLLEADGFAPSGERETEYPHPAVRSNLVISAGLALGHGDNAITPAFVARLRRLLDQSVIQVEAMWTRFGLPGRRLGLSTDWATQLSKLSGELITKYKRYADRLKSHARIPVMWHGKWPEE